MLRIAAQYVSYLHLVAFVLRLYSQYLVLELEKHENIWVSSAWANSHSVWFCGDRSLSRWKQTLQILRQHLLLHSQRILHLSVLIHVPWHWCSKSQDNGLSEKEHLKILPISAKSFPPLRCSGFGGRYQYQGKQHETKPLHNEAGQSNTPGVCFLRGQWYKNSVCSRQLSQQLCNQIDFSNLNKVRSL